ncbi:MAG: hypothetical protein IJP14_04475 [Clostridia bacterium]|nr:hypothetical protein [Clostridia bacterium]
MSKGVMNFVRGMGMGLALGCLAGAVGNQYMQNGKKGLKRNLGKALKNMSDLVQEVGDMF